MAQGLDEHAAEVNAHRPGGLAQSDREAFGGHGGGAGQQQQRQTQRLFVPPHCPEQRTLHEPEAEVAEPNLVPSGGEAQAHQSVDSVENRRAQGVRRPPAVPCHVTSDSPAAASAPQPMA